VVRICDGRMGCTADGTVGAGVASEAAAGGPLAMVQPGDEITLDVTGRTSMLEVSDTSMLEIG
jgi:dihydroxyacid dehydratase/phosphogluconate dehydratase